jgi:acetolactate synthase-1/3 small subunit
LKAEVADVGVKTLTIQLVGDQMKVKTLLELVKPYGIQEIVRTGRIALSLKGG